MNLISSARTRAAEASSTHPVASHHLPRNQMNLVRGRHGNGRPQGVDFESSSCLNRFGGSRELKAEAFGEHLESVSLDGCIVRSNYTPDAIGLAMQNWGEEQKALVRAMGLGGLLHLRKTGNFFISFTRSLLDRIDPNDSTMRLPGGAKSILGEMEICSYMDIRRGGLTLQRNNNSPSDDHYMSARYLLGMALIPQVITMNDVVSILQEHVDSPMTREQRIKTEVGTAMLAVSVVFGPRDGRNHVTNDVYRLVKEPSKLSVWNYSRYALEE